MKTMKFLVTVGMALLISVPQVNAQNKRAERKLKREMRKLEKQLDKVRDLQEDTYVPMLEELEHRRYKKFEDLNDEFKMQWELTEKERQQVAKELKRAQEEVKRAHMETRMQFKEQQEKMKEELKRAYEVQRHEMNQLRDQFPDGVYFRGKDLPEFEFHMPDIDFKLPEMKVPDEVLVMPSHGMYLSGVYDGDNKLSINSKLDGEEVDKSYDYTVADNASYIDIKASGAMKEGTVTVKIISPDSKEFQTLDLTNMADVDWSRKIDLKEEGRENLKGKWKIKVTGKNATGLYKIMLRSR